MQFTDADCLINKKNFKKNRRWTIPYGKNLPFFQRCQNKSGSLDLISGAHVGNYTGHITSLYCILEKSI